MLTAAQVRTAWPLVTDATDAQLNVALANAEMIVATDLGADQYNDALGAVAAHFARLRLEAGGSVPSSSAGKVRSASFANHSVSLADTQADEASAFEASMRRTAPGAYYLDTYGGLNAGLPLHVGGGYAAFG
jgi:hypothetical protein